MDRNKKVYSDEVNICNKSCFRLETALVANVMKASHFDSLNTIYEAATFYEWIHLFYHFLHGSHGST